MDTARLPGLFRAKKLSTRAGGNYAAPMNYWLWLLFFLPPILVFSVKPQDSAQRRIGRLALAIGLGHIFINLALHLSIERDWAAAESCRDAYSGHAGEYEKSLALMMDALCPGYPNSGLPEIFYLFLGWIPTAGYTGFWELAWRMRHRAEIHALGKAFKGKWVSSALLIFSVPVWLYVLAILALKISIVSCQWFTPLNGKCWFAHLNAPQR